MSAKSMPEGLHSHGGFYIGPRLSATVSRSDADLSLLSPPERYWKL